MPEFKRDILKTRENIFEDFEQSISKANELWYGVLRLVITLSSSFLLLSIALVEKLFPSVGGSVHLPLLLTISWILLFLSIIFGIIAELEASVFHGNRARAKGRIIHELNKKIAQGLREDVITVEDETDYLVPGKIIWGATSINLFIFAILCICLALLRNVISREVCIVILLVVSSFLAFVNVYLIQKRQIGK